MTRAPLALPILRLAAFFCMVIALAGCTPTQQLLMSLIPDGTIPVLLSHFEQVSDANRRRISELEQRRDWDGLAKFAEENIAKDKLNSDWWIIAGYAYSQGGKRKEAIESYQEAVRLSPDDMLAWSLLTQAYRVAGQPERALQIANRALNVNRDAPSIHFLLGEIQSDLGRLEPAVKSYREALQLNEKLTEAWLGLGKAYTRLGRTKERNDVALKLEKLDPAAARQLAAFQALI